MMTSDLKLTCQQSNFVNFRKWRSENTTSVQQVSVNSWEWVDKLQEEKIQEEKWVRRILKVSLKSYAKETSIKYLSAEKRADFSKRPT